jgi:hypothetical protein
LTLALSQDLATHFPTCSYVLSPVFSDNSNQNLWINIGGLKIGYPKVCIIIFPSFFHHFPIIFLEKIGSSSFFHHFFLQKIAIFFWKIKNQSRASSRQGPGRLPAPKPTSATTGGWGRTW